MKTPGDWMREFESMSTGARPQAVAVRQGPADASKSGGAEGASLRDQGETAAQHEALGKPTGRTAVACGLSRVLVCEPRTDGTPEAFGRDPGHRSLMDRD